MLTFATTQRIYLARAVVDMRKSFDSLTSLVRNQLGKDPFTGDAFAFVGIPPRNTQPIPCLACPRSGFSCGRLATDRNCPNALIQRWFCSHTVKQP